MVNSSLFGSNESSNASPIQADNRHNKSQSSSPITASSATQSKDFFLQTCDDAKTHAVEPTPSKTDIDVLISKKNDVNLKKSFFCSVPLEKVQTIITKYTTLNCKDESNKTKLPRKIFCLYCDRTFVNSNLKLKHIERCHSMKHLRRVSLRKSQNVFTSTPCIYCDKFTSTEHTLDQLFDHLVHNHANKYFACLPCQERFLNIGHLNDHNISCHVNTSQNTVEKDLSETEAILGNEETENLHALRMVKKRKKQRKKCESKLLVVNNKKYTRSCKQTKKLTTKSLESKRITVRNSRLVLKRSKRLEAKLLDQKVVSVKKNRSDKQESTFTSKLNVKPPKASTHLMTSFPDNYFQIKKITDHSIDNLKISSLTFDDVFDKAFFNRIKCNIQENLLHHIDGKLFKNEESESRISNFEKNSNVTLDTQNLSSETYGCELSLNAIAPTTLCLSTQFGEDLESQIEYGSKPSKKRTQIKQDQVHYKYLTRRKYQASILEHKENRDLSKLDMWTQYVIKNRQQKVLSKDKSEKELSDYFAGEEYKNLMRREELDRILDRRGPFEDLREEVSRKAARDKLARADDDIAAQVGELLNDLLDKVFELTQETNPPIAKIAVNCVDGASQIPSYLNLQQVTETSSENEIDRSDKIALICSSQETENFEHPNNSVREKNEKVELTGEWARSRIYVCAACGLKLENVKQFLEHKSASHHYIWVQHYEFVGNQSELYRNLSIPILGKVGVLENTQSCKVWKRSDSRLCTKCGKQCNSLGELHRHILECGGDWTWMLVRRKCKYKPFGAKSRRKRRGLVKRIYRQKTDSSEKRTYKKRFDVPRQKPSDADTIKRMLANLPAKRSTRKLISLADKPQRKQRTVKTTFKCGKLISTTTNTSSTKSTVKKDESTKLDSRPNRDGRRSLRNLNKVLASRILDTNPTLIVRRKYKQQIRERVAKKNEALKESETEKKLVEIEQPVLKTRRRSPRIVKHVEPTKIYNKMNIKRFFPIKKNKMMTNDPPKKNLIANEIDECENVQIEKSDENTEIGDSNDLSVSANAEQSSNIQEESTSSDQVTVLNSSLETIKSANDVMPVLDVNEKNTANNEKPVPKKKRRRNLIKKIKNSIAGEDVMISNGVLKDSTSVENTELFSESNATKNLKKKITDSLDLTDDFNKKPTKKKRRKKTVSTALPSDTANSSIDGKLKLCVPTVENDNKLAEIITPKKRNKKVRKRTGTTNCSSANDLNLELKLYSNNLKEININNIESEKNDEIINNVNNHEITKMSEQISKHTGNTLNVVKRGKIQSKFRRAIKKIKAMSVTQLLKIDATISAVIQASSMEENVNLSISQIIDNDDNIVKIPIKAECHDTMEIDQPLHSEPSLESKIPISINKKAVKKRRKPARGLDDCIAMLTSKLRKNETENENTVDVKSNGQNNFNFKNDEMSEFILKVPLTNEHFELYPSVKSAVEVMLDNEHIALKHNVEDCSNTMDNKRIVLNHTTEDCNTTKEQEDIFLNALEESHSILCDISDAKIESVSINSIGEENLAEVIVTETLSCALSENPMIDEKTIANDFNETDADNKKNVKDNSESDDEIPLAVYIKSDISVCLNEQDEQQTDERYTEFSDGDTQIESVKADPTEEKEIVDKQTNLETDNVLEETSVSVPVTEIFEKATNVITKDVTKSVVDGKNYNKRRRAPKKIRKKSLNTSAKENEDFKWSAMEKKTKNNKIINITTINDSAFEKNNKATDALLELTSNAQTDNNIVSPIVTEESVEQFEEACVPEKTKSPVALDISLPELEENLNESEQKEPRRSLRNSKKITCYNEVDLVDPMLDDLGGNKSITKFIKEATKSIFGGKRKGRLNKKINSKDIKLDGDELFNLLKETPSDKLEFSKPTNSFLNNFDEVSDDFNDDNFNWDDIFQKSISVLEDNLGDPRKLTLDEVNLPIDETDDKSLTNPDEESTNENVNSRKRTTKIPTFKGRKKYRGRNGESNLSPSRKNSLDAECFSNDIENFTSSNTMNSISKVDFEKNNFCEICDKSFRRIENLVKHKRTLTHISKLSELEAKEAAKKWDDEKLISTNEEDDKSINDETRMNLAVKEEKEFLAKEPNNTLLADDQSNKSPCSFSVNVNDSKLAEIINDVLNKPVDKSQENSFDDIFTKRSEEGLQQNNKRCKSLAERKCFDSDNGSGTDSLHSKEIDYFDTDMQKEPAGVILQKQISLLENIIENRTGMSYIDDISITSNASVENDNVTSKQNQLEDDRFIKPSTQYEEISEDSNLRNFEKSRKALNRDEELFLECCSLLKSSSELSGYSKKSNNFNNYLNNVDMKPSEKLEWSENLQEKEDKYFERYFSDESRGATPLDNSFETEDSNSATMASQWNVTNFSEKDQIESEFKQDDRVTFPDFKHKISSEFEDSSNGSSTVGDGKKVLTKGAMKVFEGLKVSIPTEDLNLAKILGDGSKSACKNIKSRKKVHKKRCGKPKSRRPYNNKLPPLMSKIPDVYDFEETQDNSDIFTRPDFKSFRNNNGKSKKDFGSDEESQDNDALSSSTSSVSELIASKSRPPQNITKKKCMIMGRIFKNAAKSKTIDEDIRSIPVIDNTKLVQEFVMNCSHPINNQSKMTEEELDLAFDKLLNKPPLLSDKPEVKNAKKKFRNKNKKRHIVSDSSDDEFQLQQPPKKRSIKGNNKPEQESGINMELELKECIGVASRKSQRKCTSGKQNVLIEYWSSDESTFETPVEASKPIQEKIDPPIESVKNIDLMSIEPIILEQKIIKPVEPKKPKLSTIFPSNRRKRCTANPLYHWSSSSEDESRDLIEVRPIRDEFDDDDDRPMQHGWIVGDSPKKLVTMLAQAKGKKSETDTVKECGKKRTTSTFS